MSNAIITVGELSFHVRTEKRGDEDVIGEIVTRDMYELRTLKETGFEPQVVLDIGAHIGTFAVLCHSLWPEADIFCCEPNPRSFELLRLNAPFATCLNVAIRYDGANVLTDGEGATGAGFLTTADAFDAAAQLKHEQDGFQYSILTEQVRTLTIEDVLELCGINQIDLLKFDCEGSEIDCLEHLSSESAAKIGRVLGEYHTENGFEWFRELAELRFSHLEFYGGNGHVIGPFWSKPKVIQSPESACPSASTAKALAFKHSGDLGDIIYALPTIRALGGGKLYLSESSVTRQRMTQQSLDLLAPLLSQQPYIEAVELYHDEEIDHDLDQFREYWKANGRVGCNLAAYHLGAFGLDVNELDTPWLQVDAPSDTGYPVIIHRSDRHHNPNFPWQKLANKYRHCAAFAGLDFEYRDFCERFGEVPYFPTANFLDLACVIASCQLFVGNQSSPYAVAEGLKANTIQEVYLGDANCLFPRLNALFVWNSFVTLPEIEAG